MQYGLIGEKLGHSYSAPIHNQLADYEYVLKEVPPEGLDAFMRAHDFKGINVTIPYKQAVMPYCAELSDAAREVGCVNTILVRPDGTLYGHNTDIGGFIHMLNAAGISPAGRKAVVLGSGGTSLTARAALRHLGAREIVVISRRGPVDYEALYELHSDAEILINTTPVGMYPRTGVSPVALERLPALRGVADVIYNPERTALIQDAMERHIPAVSGLTMLVAQAREAAEMFSGRAIPMEMVDKVCARIHGDSLNLVLIGMPGCGKSTLGQALAGRMRREFVDLDTEITRAAGMTIPEIFAAHGEQYFRDIESRVVEEACRGSGRIIATGGGAVLREKNRRAMGQNGRICFINRALDELPRHGRPLSASEDAVARLWSERRDIYMATADFTVRNDRDVEMVAGEIEEAFYEAVGN